MWTNSTASSLATMSATASSMWLCGPRRRRREVDFVENDLGGFPARVSYDAEVDAIAVDFGTSPYAGSDEILPGFIVDRDDDGFIRGLEFLNASRFFSEEAISDVRKRAILLRTGTRS